MAAVHDTTDALFELFYNYDWNKDARYQAGLKVVYDSYFMRNVDISLEEKNVLVSKAKRFFFRKHHGVDINAEQYNNWVDAVSGDPGRKLVTSGFGLVPAGSISPPVSAPPGAQSVAGQSHSVIPEPSGVSSSNRNSAAKATTVESAATTAANNTKYENIGAQPAQEELQTLSYDQLVELIVQGKPIPGIKTIPNIVLAEKASQPALKPRLKPWERAGNASGESQEVSSISNSIASVHIGSGSHERSSTQNHSLETFASEGIKDKGVSQTI